MLNTTCLSTPISIFYYNLSFKWQCFIQLNKTNVMGCIVLSHYLFSVWNLTTFSPITVNVDFQIICHKIVLVKPKDWAFKCTRSRILTLREVTWYIQCNYFLFSISQTLPLLKMPILTAFCFYYHCFLLYFCCF